MFWDNQKTDRRSPVEFSYKNVVYRLNFDVTYKGQEYDRFQVAKNPELYEDFIEGILAINGQMTLIPVKVKIS